MSARRDPAGAAASRAEGGDARPWFAQPALWWVLSPLLATVFAGIWLVLTATELGGTDALPGEYGKAGKLLALEPAALARSARLAAGARGTIDGGQLRFALASATRPATLNARLVHATLPDRDVTVRLSWAGEDWQATLPPVVPDRGELHVYPDDRSWRLVSPLAADGELLFAPSRR